MVYNPRHSAPYQAMAPHWLVLLLTALGGPVLLVVALATV